MSGKDCVDPCGPPTSRAAYEVWQLQLDTDGDSNEPWHRLVKHCSPGTLLAFPWEAANRMSDL